MEKQLLFLFRNPAGLQLLLRAGIAALATLFVFWGSFSFWSILIFLIVFVSLYLTEEGNRRSVRTSFFLIPLLALIGGIALFSEGSYIAPLFFLISFFVVLYAYVTLHGIARFLTEERERSYVILHTVLLLLTLILFSKLVWLSPLWMFVLFAVLALLFTEGFRFFSIPQARISGAVLGFIGAELLLISRFLPLGFLNMAAFVGLILFLLRDVLKSHFLGKLDKKQVMRSVTLFVLFSLIIFAASSWTI